MVIVQLVDAEDVHQVFGKQSAVRLGLQVVGRLVVLDAPAQGMEQPGRLIEFPAGQKSERQEGVRRADDSQVDLERTHSPGRTAALTGRHEIDAETADDAVIGEDTTDPQRQPLDDGAIGVLRREAAADIDLAELPPRIWS